MNNRLFVLFSENANTEKVIKDFPPTVEITDYIVMIEGQNFFDQPITNDILAYENRKIATGQRYDYMTGCLNYPYFKGSYKFQ